MALYGEPELYELAFSYRDVVGEVDAVDAWYARNRAGRPKCVLELAAGPAAHALELARRGAAVTALDLSAAMCAHARRRARQAGVPLDVVRADMVSFRLPRRRFDLVCTMLDSASHLLTDDAMVTHLRSVATHLVPGGLYVMEMSHPDDVGTASSATQDRWQVSRNGTRVDVRWSTPKSAYDPTTQVGQHRISVTVRSEGSRRIVRDTIALRRWTEHDLDAVIRRAGCLTVAARHGSFDNDAPFGSGPAEWRMISVLKR